LRVPDGFKVIEIIAGKWLLTACLQEELIWLSSLLLYVCLDYLREFHAHVVSEMRKGFAHQFEGRYRYCLTVRKILEKHIIWMIYGILIHLFNHQGTGNVEW
jgi:hypothetical protein